MDELTFVCRGWIIRAFFEDNVRNSPETALEFYTSAIEVLKWGAERWKGVSSEETGSVFQPTFARGIKCLRLDAHMKVSFVCLVYDVGADTYYHATRLANRTPTNFLSRSYLQEQMRFSLNLPIHQSRHTYLTFHSSCRSPATPSEKRTREPQNTLCSTSGLTICAQCPRLLPP